MEPIMMMWMLVWTTRGGRGPAFLLLVPFPIPTPAAAMPSPTEFETPLTGKEFVEKPPLLVPMLVLVWVMAVSLVSHACCCCRCCCRVGVECSLAAFEGDGLAFQVCCRNRLLILAAAEDHHQHLAVKLLCTSCAYAWAWDQWCLCEMPSCCKNSQRPAL